MKNTGRVPPPSELRRRVADGRYRRVEPSRLYPTSDTPSWRIGMSCFDAADFDQATGHWPPRQPGGSVTSLTAVPGTRPAVAAHGIADSPTPLPASDEPVASLSPVPSIRPAPLPDLPPAWSVRHFEGAFHFTSGDGRLRVYEEPDGLWVAQTPVFDLKCATSIDAVMSCYGFRQRVEDTLRGTWWCFPGRDAAVRDTEVFWVAYRGQEKTEHTTWWEAVAAALGKTPQELGMVWDG